MHSVESNSASGQYVQQVARKFVALYYRVLNNYASYLFRFYGSDSTIVVCQVKEDGQPMTTKADNSSTVQQLLRSLYEEATITVRNCTPQTSSGGCISLLITGLMSQKPHVEDKAFTQALILSRQSDGYYVKTDTVLMFPAVKSGSGPCSLLTPSSHNTEVTAESKDDTAMRGPPNGKSKLEVPRAIREGTQSRHHARVPTIDAGAGTPSIATNRDRTQPAISFADGTIERRETNHDIAFSSMPYLTQHQRQPFSSADIAPRNRQGCNLANDRIRPVPAPSGFMNHLNPFPDRCASPLSAPGVLAPSLNGERLVPDLTRYQQHPWSLRSSPRNLITDAAQPVPNEHVRLFACKLDTFLAHQDSTCLSSRLPLGITVEQVTEIFSQYGTLAEDEPIRVFTGQNNCYACVCYATETDMQKAIGAEIRIGENLVVTDEWRPRPRRPRRGRQEAAPEQRPLGATN